MDGSPSKTTAEPLTATTCEARGGHVVGDPGDGSTLRDGCPNGDQNLGLIAEGIEGSICCKSLPLLTADECQTRGGEVIGDPGDGSTHRDGCPNGRTNLGPVRLGIEGGICCEPAR